MAVNKHSLWGKLEPGHARRGEPPGTGNYRNGPHPEGTRGRGPPRPPRLGATLPAAERAGQAKSSGLFHRSEFDVRTSGCTRDRGHPPHLAVPSADLILRRRLAATRLEQGYVRDRNESRILLRTNPRSASRTRTGHKGQVLLELIREADGQLSVSELSWECDWREAHGPAEGWIGRSRLRAADRFINNNLPVARSIPTHHPCGSWPLPFQRSGSVSRNDLT